MEVEGKVLWFKNNPPDIRGVAKTKAGLEVDIVASSFTGPGTNGDRAFAEKGDTVLMRVVRTSRGGFAPSWRKKSET